MARFEHEFDGLFELRTGGPGEPTELLGSFRKGERIALERVSVSGDYPTMYRIAGRPAIGQLSRGVVAKFVHELEP